MVLIMLKIGDELSENIMPKVQKSGASQMNGIFSHSRSRVPIFGPETFAVLIFKSF